METVGVVVGPWAVGGIRADQDSVVWAGNGGLIVTPVKYPRRTHSHPPVVKDEEQREKTEETNEETQEEEKVTDEDQKVIEEEDSRTSYFSTFSPLVSLDRVELSPSGSVVIVGGCIAGGMGVLIWRDWPLIQDSPGHTLMTGHKIYHLEFSSRGDYLGVLSIPELKRIEADADLEYPEMVLTIWRWPVQENAEESDVEAEDADGHNTEDFSDEELVTRRSINCPRKLLVTTMPQLKPEQVNRMSLARGLPDGVIAAMIAAEDELSVWQVIDGPLGLRIQSSTIGFGLHEPDQVLSMYCLAMDAYALGVGGGWVVVGVDGEVRVWLGGGGCRPCHQGPVMDLMLLGSHLYTVGGDGWLRMWEAETLEEAAVKAGGMGATTNGWSEEGMTKAWLQLLREVVVHKGPGVPVTILPMIMPNHSAWIVQTNTGVLYSVWEGEWTSRILHQGPSGRVTGVAIAPNQPLLAVTSHHRYLQITQLPQISAEGLNGAEGKRHIKVPTAIAQAEIPGSPRCVTWAICQVTEEDNLLVVGLEDGSINLYLLHITPKLSNTQLTLVQMERPHELPVVFISASSTQQTESSNHLPVVVTASEDCRIFIFCLVKAGKVTKLEPVGFHQLEAVAERVEVKGAVIIVEMNAGIVLEIPLPTIISSVDNSPSGETSIMSNRISPDSWLLQCHTNRRELWEGSTVVRKQLLEEAAQAYCTEEPHAIVVLTMPSLDGKTMLGVTALGRVVHLHQSQDSYSIRLSRRSSVSLQMSPESPTSKMQKTLRLSSESPAGERKSSTPDLKVDNLALSPGRQSRSFSSRRGSPKRLPSVDEEDIKCVVGCVSRDGSWVTAWIEGNDLLVYCAKGTSFPTPHPKELQLRLVAIRGVVIAESGPSLEQRAQKEARERQKVAMEEKASLLQQKLSKLKWDFKKLSLRGDAIEGGQQLLEDLPLHPTITSSLNNQTTQNMNKVVGGSSGELERLEVLLGKLRTLFSWNPLVNLLVVSAFEIDETLSDVDMSQEVFALLSHLAQIRGSAKDEEGGAGETVSHVKDLLAKWLQDIRSCRPNKQQDGSQDLDGATTSNSPMPAHRRPSEPEEKMAKSGLDLKPENQNAEAAKLPSLYGDTSQDDCEQDSLTSLQAQVREVVERVGSAGRGAGADGGVSEADLDVGRELKWRRTALSRLQEYRSREDARTAQLTSYKVDHNLPLKDAGEEGDGEGPQAEEEQDQHIEDEITVPPVSTTVEEVESLLWGLLGKVDIDSKNSQQKIKDVASAQLALLQQVNQRRAEWGHPPYNLTHQQQHLDVKVTDEIVNEFYCDLLDLDEPLESSGRYGAGDSTQRGTITSRRTKSSPRTPATDSDRKLRYHGKKNSEERDIPPLSLSGSPRAAKYGKTPRTATTSRTLTTSRTARTGQTGATTTRTPKTHRSGKGRKSVRDSPKPPPAPRPMMTLDQVQEIQRRRTGYLTAITQVPEAIQDVAKEADQTLLELGRQVDEERGCLAWAVLRAGQLVKSTGVRIKHRDDEKKLRMALRERIKERQVVKEKVLALRERIHEYDKEIECLVSLEEEIERAFNHLVTDNAQFEVQLTRYFESRAVPGLVRRQSVSSSSEDAESGDDDGADSGDNDSGLGTDEARMDENGPRPPGCDPAVFSLVTLLRDLRWQVSSAVDKSRRERTGEERRHAAVLRRLVRANHLCHSALSSLTSLQGERDRELGAIPTIIWLRRSQTDRNIETLTELPYPNIQSDSLAAVRWGRRSRGTLPSLLTLDHLQQLEQRLAQAKKAQELAIRKHRESRAERRTLTHQVAELRHDLENLQQAYQITRECKLGLGADANLEEIKGKLETGLDLRWPGKVASQLTRHDANVSQLQKDYTGKMRELRALQKEEAALAAHILALRQEKDHLHYHLAQSTSATSAVKPKPGKPKGRQVGQVQELERLRGMIAQQDITILALRREISTLRCKTGSVTLPGAPPPPPSKFRPSSSSVHTPSTHRSEPTYGAFSSTRPTTGTESSEVMVEEELVFADDDCTSAYDEEEGDVDEDSDNSSNGESCI